MSYVLLLMFAAMAPVQVSSAPATQGDGVVATPATKLEMSEPVAYSFAGVKLAMPKNFEIQPFAGPNSVVRAVRTKNEQPIMSVGLSVFAQKPDVTLDEFVKNNQPGRDDLSVRSYKQLGASSIKVAGLSAKAILVSYEYRSTPTKALMIYFLRPLQSGELKLELGYLLVAEGDKENFSTVYGAACEIASHLQLTDVVHPGEQPVGELTIPIESRANGYSIKIPDTWKFQLNRERSQVQMYQMDFLMGGQATPNMTFTTKPEISPPEVAAKVVLRNVEDSMTKANIEHQVVREGPVKMAGLDGYEFLLKQSIGSRESDAVRTTMLMVRLVCNNGRSYAFVLGNEGADADWMTAAMDKVASSLEVTAPVTSMPTTLPGSGESTSRPGRESSPVSSKPVKPEASNDSASPFAATEPAAEGAGK